MSPVPNVLRTSVLSVRVVTTSPKLEHASLVRLRKDAKSAMRRAVRSAGKVISLRSVARTRSASNAQIH